MDKKILSIPLHYAEHGVYQCWTCTNCISSQNFYLTVNTDEGIDNKVLFLLPECKVTDQYMLYTASVPCEKYKSFKTGD